MRRNEEPAMTPRSIRRHRDTLMFAIAYAVIAAAVLFAQPFAAPAPEQPAAQGIAATAR